MSRFGVTATYLDTNNLGELESHVQPNTKGILIETPTNPLMMVTDVEAVCGWAKKKRALLRSWTIRC